MNLPSKQTGLPPLICAFSVLICFMGNFVFLIFIMARAHGQMPPMQNMNHQQKETKVTKNLGTAFEAAFEQLHSEPPQKA